jgi:hypothetical protein
MCFVSAAQDGVADFSTRGGFRSAGVAGGGEAIKCFRCNGLNHYARDCLAPVPTSSAAASVTTGKACYNCGKTGHVRLSLQTMMIQRFTHLDLSEACERLYRGQ